jgi:hypothetical protein
MSKSRVRRVIDQLEAKGRFSRTPADVLANFKRSGKRAEAIVAALGDTRHRHQALCILEIAKAIVLARRYPRLASMRKVEEPYSVAASMLCYELHRRYHADKYP